MLIVKFDVALNNSGVSIGTKLQLNGTDYASNTHGNETFAVIKGAEYNDLFIAELKAGDIVNFLVSQSASSTIGSRVTISSNKQIN